MPLRPITRVIDRKRDLNKDPSHVVQRRTKQGAKIKKKKEYRWKGRDSDGRTKRGKVRTADPKQVERILARQGITPERIV